MQDTCRVSSRLKEAATSTVCALHVRRRLFGARSSAGLRRAFACVRLAGWLAGWLSGRYRTVWRAVLHTSRRQGNELVALDEKRRASTDSVSFTVHISRRACMTDAFRRDGFVVLNRRGAACRRTYLVRELSSCHMLHRMSTQQTSNSPCPCALVSYVTRASSNVGRPTRSWVDIYLCKSSLNYYSVTCHCFKQ